MDCLPGRGNQPKDICIFWFYKEQLRRISEKAAELDVDIATVDSEQGRQKEMVIMLTTRTDTATMEPVEFVNNPRL